MDLESRVAALVMPTLDDMGFELVRVQVSGGEHRPTLQVMAERPEDGTMTVEDCAEISRAISAILDVEDPVAGAYTLEVSSPGLDRPLTRPKDYVRYAGFEVRLETNRPIPPDNRKRFKGRLLGLSEPGQQITLATDTGDITLAMADIHRAKLVMTDELIAAALKQQQNQETQG